MAQKKIRDLVREVDESVGGIVALAVRPTVRQLEELGGAAGNLAALLDRAGSVRMAEACRAAAKLVTDCEVYAESVRRPDPEGPAGEAVTKAEFDERLQEFRASARWVLGER